MPNYRYNGTLELKFSNIQDQIDFFSELGFSDMDSDISWSDPIGTVMLKAHAEAHEITIDAIPCNSYMRNMLTLGIDYIPTKPTYTPIVQIKGRHQTEYIRDSLTSTIMKNFSALTESFQIDLRRYLNYMFSELLNNVSDHSFSDIGGFAMAQYYETHRKVQFAIADKGCGFLANIQAKFPEIQTEEDAILKAMQKAVTASKNYVYGQTRNAGFGLFALETILKYSNGNLIIISNDTMLKMDSSNKTIHKLPVSWNGVVVAFEFFEENTNYNFEQIQRIWGAVEEGEEEDDFFL
ncbi:hypothetical protein FA592_06555 [Sulfurospirillum diekertiae]|uniref:Uncharacterized protein n=1 Tax=Sulfurospirillum diekertiae TaxID=1854492 RepID=A0A6G9VTA0_9BACT|nr:hypothetical protein [Sulfurospirillum diekertiae]QIR75908.1 hypothetical protein FA584_06675 [Sulfurospirillum diekertiae]QIR78550.1 hypothetical protein FA592_06555 [Sulfurospirillum diekertiae]